MPVIRPILSQERNFHIYALLCQDDDGPGYLKLGYSCSLDSRLDALRRGCPVTPRIFAFSEIGWSKRLTLQVERALKRQFADRCVNGEWFRFDFDSATDKQEFNDGCRKAFASVLGDKVKPWNYVDVEELAKMKQRTRRWAVATQAGRRMMRRTNGLREAKRAQKELSA